MDSVAEAPEQSVSLIAITFAVGAIVLLLYYITTGWRKINQTDAESIESDQDAKSNGTKQQTKKQQKGHIKPAKKTVPTFNHPLLHTTLKGHTGTVLGLDASINGKYLASCSDDRTVRLWSVKEFGSGNRSVRVNVELDHAKQARFSPDSRAFIAGLAYDNTVRVFKMSKSDSGVTSCTPIEEDFPRYTKSELLNIGVGASASGGSFVMTAYKDTTIIIRDIKGSELYNINTNQGSNNHAMVSPCGRFVASSGWTPDVKVWAVVFDRSGDYKEVTRAFELKGHASSVWSFDFNNDSTRMITISKDGSWRFYDTQIEYDKGQEAYLLNSGTIDICSISMADNHCLIALSSDARVAAVACLNSIAVFSTASGHKEVEFKEAHSAIITALTFDIGGKYILSSGDRQIRVFHNILGYKEIIRDLEEQQKKHAVGSSMRERQQKQIDVAKKALDAILKSSKEKNQ